MANEYVALLAEGVDRNPRPSRLVAGRFRSPSSRRAWIEIDSMPCRNLMKPVALLAEGVDRNL